MYTLAIVLWELLTGQQYLPISGLDPSAGLALVRHPKPTPPSIRAPWIAPELDRVVLRALAPDRQQRFQSAEEFRLALSDVIAKVAPRTDPARVDVIPAFRASSSAPPARERPTQPSVAHDKPRSASQSNRTPARTVHATPKPPGPREENHDGSDGMRLPGVTPVPVAVDGRAAHREAALRVLAELAAEDAAPTPSPVQARK